MEKSTMGLIGEGIGLLITGVSVAPKLVSLGTTLIGLLNSDTDPTPQQRLEIRRALDESHAALQASAREPAA